MARSLTRGQAAFVAKLRARLPKGFPLEVTSAGRSAAAQASAMLVKYQAGGAEALYALYAADATIAKLVAAPKTVSAWTAVIEAETARGVKLSRHLVGGALDFRTQGLTSSQIAQLTAAAKALGGKPLLEASPPHLHVDLPTVYAAASSIERAAPWVAGAWLVGGAVVLGALVLRQRRIRRLERAA